MSRRPERATLAKACATGAATRRGVVGEYRQHVTSVGVDLQQRFDFGPKSRVAGARLVEVGEANKSIAKRRFACLQSGRFRPGAKGSDVPSVLDYASETTST